MINYPSFTASSPVNDPPPPYDDPPPSYEETMAQSGKLSESADIKQNTRLWSILSHHEFSFSYNQ